MYVCGLADDDISISRLEITFSHRLLFLRYGIVNSFGLVFFNSLFSWFIYCYISKNSHLYKYSSKRDF